MANKIEGKLTPVEGKFAIVVTRWNSFITERLKEGALDALVRHGLSESKIDIVYCPGAYEIPLTLKWLLNSGKYDAAIALGAVIRGSTPHFDYVCQTVNRGVADAGLSSGIPVSFGVLTTDSIEQAIERAGTKAGNKGEEAAMAAVEMLNLKKSILG